MKYLNNRESFLNSNSKLKKDFKLIKENTAGAGPFANEINWGDSLLGRLVNHFTRKAGIGVDMMKISNVTSKLEQEFKNIIDTSMVLAVSDEDKVNISRLKISSLIGQLRDVVYDKKSVKTIKSVCDSTISEVESIKESDLGTDLNKSKLELLEKLKEFRKFLDQFKDDEKSQDDEKEQVQGQGQAQGQGQSQGQTKVNDVLYSNYVKNFKVVLKLCQAYMILKKSKNDNPGIEAGVKKVTTPNNEKLQKKYQELLNQWKEEQKKLGNKTNLNPDEGTKKRLEKEAAKLVESNLFSIYENQQNSVFIPLKSLYNYVTGFLKVDDIDSVLKMDLNSDKFRNSIIKIYSVVRKNNINESIDELLTRPEEIGKKISQLYSITKSKPDGGFDYKEINKGGISAEMQTIISEFNSTMLECLVDNKTSERVLTNYSKFVKLIREADGDEKDDSVDDSNPDKIKTQTTSDKIIEYFDKNMNFDAWVIEKTEAEKIEKNIEEYSKGENKEIVLSGIDPILNIVKLFNRAYKIHTVPVIPGGRSGGVMSGIGGRKTFSEYDAFGYTSGEPNAITQGPYRNKKVFNIWEDTVLDIMSKREYQPIFSKKTKIQVGNELKSNVGIALRQFMTDMLDGEKLYKGERGEGGSTQKKFLAKYFGDIVDTEWEKLPDSKISYSTGGEPDVDVNSEQAGKIPSPKYGFFDEKKTNIDNTEGIVFSIFGKDNTDKDIRYYGFVRKEEGGFLYLVYSSSFLIIRNICGQSIKGSPEFEPGDGKLNMSPTAKLYSTKIKIEDFKNMIKSTGKLNLKGIDFDSNITEVTFNTVERRYILSNEKDGKFTNLLVKDKSTITDWCNKNNVNIKDDKIPESNRK